MRLLSIGDGGETLSEFLPIWIHLPAKYVLPRKYSYPASGETGTNTRIAAHYEALTSALLLRFEFTVGLKPGLLRSPETFTMDLISNLRSLLHLKPKELIVPGDIPATLANCGGNVAAAEQFPGVMDFFARELMRLFPAQLGEGKAGCMIAAACPEAMVLTAHLAYLANTRFASVQIIDGTPKMPRHHLIPKEKVVLVIDECRNFIRLNEAMAALAPYKVQVVAVACIVNGTGRNEFSFLERVPILSLYQGTLPTTRSVH